MVTELQIMSFSKLDIKKSPGYFFSSMTNIMNLNTNSIGINKIYFSDSDITYFIESYENNDSFSSLYLIFNEIDASFMSFDENKYLIFAKTEKNKEIIEKYEEL